MTKESDKEIEENNRQIEGRIKQEREDVSKRYLHTHKESKTEKYRNKQDKGNEREREENEECHRKK